MASQHGNHIRKLNSEEVLTQSVRKSHRALVPSCARTHKTQIDNVANFARSRPLEKEMRNNLPSHSRRKMANVVPALPLMECNTFHPRQQNRTIGSTVQEEAFTERT